MQSKNKRKKFKKTKIQTKKQKNKNKIYTLSKIIFKCKFFKVMGGTTEVSY